MFEDEYLYSKQIKKSRVRTVNNIEYYQIDWNDNGEFLEYGIDYIGLKSSLESKPTVVKIDSVNRLKINGVNYKLVIKNDKMIFSENQDSTEAFVSLITELVPIELEDSTVFFPELTRDSTVIYFWATWCRPCIETLKKITLNLEKLKAEGIEFIPIAYNCTGTIEFLSANKLPFQDLKISEESARIYNIKSLSKQYTFFKNGEIADANVNLRKYYE